MISDNSFNIILKYIFEPYFEVCDASKGGVDWHTVSYASKYTNYLLKNKDKIVWDCFSYNSHPKAVNYLLNHPEKIYLSTFLCNSNSRAVKYVLGKLRHMDMDEHVKLLRYSKLASNRNRKAILYIRGMIHQNARLKTMFSVNGGNSAVDYLIDNPDLIDWHHFSFNPSDKAVNYLINDHPEKIDRDYFANNFNLRARNYIKKKYPELDIKPYVKCALPINPIKTKLKKKRMRKLYL